MAWRNLGPSSAASILCNSDDAPYVLWINWSMLWCQGWISLPYRFCVCNCTYVAAHYSFLVQKGWINIFLKLDYEHRISIWPERFYNYNSLRQSLSTICLQRWSLLRLIDNSCWVIMIHRTGLSWAWLAVCLWRSMCSFFTPSYDSLTHSFHTYVHDWNFHHETDKIPEFV